MNDILNFTSQLARDAGNLILTYYKTHGLQTDLKPDRTVVTEADLAANELIHDAIQRRFPNDGILSEEGYTHYPTNETKVWIIDPLDGTTNFSLGLHYWGVLIALLKNGVPEMAVSYFPMLDELYTAIRGEGAFLNEKLLHVKSPSTTKPVTFFSCCSRTHRYYDIHIPYKTRILGSAGYGLCTIARGTAILAFEVTPKVWDFSGSWLITQEAGGTIAPFDGGTPFPLEPGVDYRNISYPMLAAATRQEWEKGRENIRKKEL